MEKFCNREFLPLIDQHTTTTDELLTGEGQKPEGSQKEPGFNSIEVYLEEFDGQAQASTQRFNPQMPLAYTQMEQ